jgi:hypothetical protein
MEISLRKARKLEAKIQATADSLVLNSAVKVRALASKEERDQVLFNAREEYKEKLQLQKDLIVARFQIRQQISDANEAVGINNLMSDRECLQALLAKSNASVDTLDQAEAEDMVSTRKNSLENGSSRAYGESSVTLTLPVSLPEDAVAFQANEKVLKLKLEEIEDQLSQKNIGAKISLDEDTVNLLKSVGLI